MYSTTICNCDLSAQYLFLFRLLEPGIHGELILTLRPGSLWLLLPLDLLVEVELVLLLVRLLDVLPWLHGMEDPVPIIPNVSVVNHTGH